MKGLTPAWRRCGRCGFAERPPFRSRGCVACGADEFRSHLVERDGTARWGGDAGASDAAAKHGVAAGDEGSATAPTSENTAASPGTPEVARARRRAGLALAGAWVRGTFQGHYVGPSRSARVGGGGRFEVREAVVQRGVVIDPVFVAGPPPEDAHVRPLPFRQAYVPTVYLRVGSDPKGNPAWQEVALLDVWLLDWQDEQRERDGADTVGVVSGTIYGRLPGEPPAVVATRIVTASRTFTSVTHLPEAVAVASAPVQVLTTPVVHSRGCGAAPLQPPVVTGCTPTGPGAGGCGSGGVGSTGTGCVPAVVGGPLVAVGCLPQVVSAPIAPGCAPPFVERGCGAPVRVAHQSGCFPASVAAPLGSAGCGLAPTMHPPAGGCMPGRSQGNAGWSPGCLGILLAIVAGVMAFALLGLYVSDRAAAVGALLGIPPAFPAGIGAVMAAGLLLALAGFVFLSVGANGRNGCVEYLAVLFLGVPLMFGLSAALLPGGLGLLAAVAGSAVLFRAAGRASAPLALVGLLVVGAAVLTCAGVLVSDHRTHGTTALRDELRARVTAATSWIPVEGTCSATSADLAVGSTVRVGAHTAVGGFRNWSAEMDAFVGKTATVRSLEASPDIAGCALARLDVDSGAWAWRVSDLEVLAAPETASGDVSVAATAAPDAMAAAAPVANDVVPEGTCEGSFPELVPGARVSLGRHERVAGQTNWTDEMDAFVGQTTTIVRLGAKDPSGCAGARVEADNERWFWRLANMTVLGTPTDAPAAATKALAAVQEEFGSTARVAAPDELPAGGEAAASPTSVWMDDKADSARQDALARAQDARRYARDLSVKARTATVAAGKRKRVTADASVDRGVVEGCVATYRGAAGIWSVRYRIGWWGKAQGIEVQAPDESVPAAAVACVADALRTVDFTRGTIRQVERTLLVQ